MTVDFVNRNMHPDEGTLDVVFPGKPCCGEDPYRSHSAPKLTSQPRHESPPEPQFQPLGTVTPPASSSRARGYLRSDCTSFDQPPSGGAFRSAMSRFWQPAYAQPRVVTCMSSRLHLPSLIATTSSPLIGPHRGHCQPRITGVYAREYFPGGTRGDTTCSDGAKSRPSTGETALKKNQPGCLERCPAMGKNRSTVAPESKARAFF